MGSVIIIKINEKEKQMISDISKLNNSGISTWVKNVIFEKLEDEYDLKVIKEYENEKRKGTATYSPIETLFEKYGVNVSSSVFK